MSIFQQDQGDMVAIVDASLPEDDKDYVCDSMNLSKFMSGGIPAAISRLLVGAESTLSSTDGNLCFYRHRQPIFALGSHESCHQENGHDMSPRW